MKRKWVKWFALISVGIFGMVFFLACGGDSDDSDPCSGPVPCLTQDWGGTYYQFNESNGSPVIVT